MDSKRTIYSIGYSSFTKEEFADVLAKYGITAVADVRSSPYSSFHPEYNKDNLRTFLKSKRIEYVHLGHELGARFEDQGVYTNNQVNFEKVAAHPLFKQGLKRIEEGARSFSIALMCAEKDPLTCHRTLLVSRNLASNFTVLHILGDGGIEEHSTTEERLLKIFKLDQFKLPGVCDEQLSLNEAYRLQAQKIAYRLDEIECEKESRYA